jgi:hypothetical protein
LKILIKFEIDDPKMGMSLKPSTNEPWEISVYGDCDFCGDRSTRKSVIGYIIFLNDVAISWKSKSQNNLSLSSTEAEYVAISVAVRETNFITNLLDSLKINFKKPIKVTIDNAGAVVLIKNWNISESIRHIVDEGLTEVEFARTKSKIADLFTKSSNESAFQKRVGNIQND